MFYLPLDISSKTEYNLFCCRRYGRTQGYGRLAQLGEHLPYKQRVIGSSPIVPTIPLLTWALSSAGRASALQAEGHRFEPYSAHHVYGPVVQLVRMPACHAGGRGFEPHPDRQKGYCCTERCSNNICLCSSVGRAGD